MMMIIVIILMLDDENVQKSSTTMTFWSKYTLIKYYYLVKKGPNQPGSAHLKTFFLFVCLPLGGFFASF